ncbi:hypothetical protein BBK36DRAFT_1201897 [Trichoderma citrinoviride]|uniref:Uncharacterized protein n=1 Tax=Trichoderma citrinoviride TaxID=58853 RepID=A0A2T4B859_9HYPO|nr:hypothetical protein BBK36DRAFT_1201897 [Trichoderma citrinoviride]PTB65515.1 hypothetical protein BBK36DRAFT_1201897 [Trichoderma citrinoviride]
MASLIRTNVTSGIMQAISILERLRSIDINRKHLSMLEDDHQEMPFPKTRVDIKTRHEGLSICTVFVCDSGKPSSGAGPRRKPSTRCPDDPDLVAYPRPFSSIKIAWDRDRAKRGAWPAMLVLLDAQLSFVKRIPIQLGSRHQLRQRQNVPGAPCLSLRHRVCVVSEAVYTLRITGFRVLMGSNRRCLIFGRLLDRDQDEIQQKQISVRGGGCTSQ